MASYLNL